MTAVVEQVAEEKKRKQQERNNARRREKRRLELGLSEEEHAERLQDRRRKIKKLRVTLTDGSTRGWRYGTRCGASKRTCPCCTASGKRPLGG